MKEVYRVCPNCEAEILVEEEKCGCIIGHCLECNTDFDSDENCILCNVCHKRKKEEGSDLCKKCNKEADEEYDD